MSFRPLLIPVAVLVSLSVLLAGPAKAAEPVEMPVAEAMLDALEKVLKSKKSLREQIIADMEEVAEAYPNLKKPDAPELEEVPADADEETQKAIKARNAKIEKNYKSAVDKFEKAADKWRKSAEKQLLKAMRLVKVNRQTEANLRDDVNIRAAELLAETKNPELTDDIIKTLETTVFKAKLYQPSQLFLQKSFEALGKLNDPKALQWMMKEFMHTRSSPPEQVDRLIAAHKAMVLFQAVPGKLRHDVVEVMVKNYAGVESQAEQSSTDPKIQEKKQFWDRIKTDAIKVVQYYSGEPTDDEGAALATMKDFQDWFRDHKNPKKAPWKDDKS